MERGIDRSARSGEFGVEVGVGVWSPGVARSPEILPAETPAGKGVLLHPCYRREAGGYRTEQRGTVHGHQFNKVEMFQFTAPEQAEDALQELVGRAQMLVEKLGLHYQTSLLATRDASASMRLTDDIEVWLPSIGIYKEVSSASWAGDYQATGPASATGQRRASPPPTSTPSTPPAWRPAACCPRSSNSTSSPMAPSPCPSRCAPGLAPTFFVLSANHARRPGATAGPR
jgi:tRNA synthetase class II core domain (G, H, P, S and T)